MSALRQPDGWPPLLSGPTPTPRRPEGPAASSALQGVWRGDALDPADTSTLPTGFPVLDAALPGQGWPTQALTEVLLAPAGLCEWRLVAPAVAPLAAAGGPVLLVAPPRRPHAGGLAQWGIDAGQLVWIDAATPAEGLWVTEQLLKANPANGAILAWLPQAQPAQMRRLQVHAQGCAAPAFVFRPTAARLDASAAPLRLAVEPGHAWQLQLRILKRRGPPHEGLLQLRSIAGPMAAVLPPRVQAPPVPQAQGPTPPRPAIGWPTAAPAASFSEVRDARLLGRAAPDAPRRHAASH